MEAVNYTGMDQGRRRLLIATTNRGKIREIRQVLEGLPVDLVTLDTLAPIPEPDETGQSFSENAALKARAYAAATGLPTVAEDSGLVIDALDGRPGVESARYPGATYPEKFANLYRELDGHPRPWTARFVCAVAFIATPTGAAAAGRMPVFPAEAAGIAFAATATVEGEIASAPAGSEGFGYDPIFYYPPYGCTFGSVSGARKLAVAHRGKAFRVFRRWLEEMDGKPFFSP
jgi:XTP/dITP diphosphohydrolase